jgi:hypothetical protein
MKVPAATGCVRPAAGVLRRVEPYRLSEGQPSDSVSGEEFVGCCRATAAGLVQLDASR